ncbi:MAG: trypsin-like peptidase domain-containing protein [Verrucomicrobiae bacterium]|nr:trypsin-like peptidase domain-containing protein [Verrucomicrobiae bacterium]
MNMRFRDLVLARQRVGVRLAAFALAAGWGAVACAASATDVRRDATVLAIEKAKPSVVNIATARIVEYRDFYQELLRQFYGAHTPSRRREQLDSIGSGVIIHEDGYVLSNLHVVRRASRVQVKLWDGTIYDAEPVVGTEQSDVALLRLKAPPGKKFQAIQLAEDDDLLLGETVLALGNPYGLGESVSRGILSSKNRRPPVGDEPLEIADWLQTDAAINPGNSGGPLINLRGELIGLNVAVYQGQGIGFAIPVKQVSAALSQFFAPELTDELWLGVRLQANSSPPVITAVQPGSPAEKAGLRPGQQVLQVNGQAVNNLIGFTKLVAAAGRNTLNLLVAQNQDRRSVRVTLVPFPELIREKLGLVLDSPTPQGLLISEVEANSPADRAQLQRGFLLAAMDGQPTRDLWKVGNLLTTKQPGDQVQLMVVVPRRSGGGYPRQVAVTLRVR